MPGKSIQGIWAALISARAKMKQAQAKLMTTARTEMNALKLRARWVKSTMTALATSGVNKAYQGRALVIGD